jgi:hypothetical protein
MATDPPHNDATGYFLVTADLADLACFLGGPPLYDSARAFR